MSTINVNSIDKESGGNLTLGGSGTQVTLHASATSSGFDSGLASVQVFTSSGTWTRPSGITKVVMHVVGGGGGGGGGRSAYNYQGDGGGAGGLAIKFLDVSSISSSTITVGAATSEAAIDVVGSSGNNSSWADGTNTITGNGGSGGNRGGDSIYTAGGSASGGDINVTGGSGAAGLSPNLANFSGGLGGICSHGFGGGPGAMIRSSSNNNATGYGHGGSGGPTNTAAGSGAPGIVVVWEYK